jgi:RNA-binding protein 23/39
MVLAQLANANLSLNTVVPAAMPELGHQIIPATNGMSRVPTVAEARASLAAHGNARTVALPQQPTVYGALLSNPGTNVVAIDPMKIGNSENPSKTLLIHNMFNKDEETDPGWENDIRDEFQDECSKYGTIVAVKVMHTEPGGKIFATFDSITGAQNCASNLAGRWFDKRQLRVEYVLESP